MTAYIGIDPRTVRLSGAAYGQIEMRVAGTPSEDTEQ